MTDDFLSSLAAQVLGTGSAVRPRTASRFESHLDAGVLRRPWPKPAEVEDNVCAPPARAVAEDARPDFATISPLAARSLSWDAELDKRASIGAPAAIHPSSAAPPARSEGASATGEPGLAAQPEPPLMVTARNADAPGQRTPGAPAVPPLLPGDSARQPGVQPAPPAAQTKPAEPRAVAVQARRAALPALPVREPAGPTIQVTIGRLEVRATTSAPVQPVSRPASPIMTLEEYLRRKTERENQ